MGKHLLVIAMGIDADGVHVLGVVRAPRRAPTCATSAACVERARLVVIDGSKGSDSARHVASGHPALPCPQDQERGASARYPALVRSQDPQGVEGGAATAATKQLDAVVKELETDHPGAAASLREGMQETLTVTRLRVQGPLLRTLRSTNTIENLNGTIKHVSRNVKRWRSGSMIVRWAVTALIEAESKFRRVRGYRDIAKLDAALNTAVDVPLEQERRTA